MTASGGSDAALPRPAGWTSARPLPEPRQSRVASARSRKRTILDLDVEAPADPTVADALRDDLAAVARVAASRLALPDVLHVAVVDDAAMIDVHRRSHGDATVTDVVTYELERNPEGRVVEGDVIVCLGEARRQAAAREHTMRLELLLYALHGLLHLCGHDDLDEASYRAMHAAEDELLTAAGFGPAFAAGDDVP